MTQPGDAGRSGHAAQAVSGDASPRDRARSETRRRLLACVASVGGAAGGVPGGAGATTSPPPDGVRPHPEPVRSWVATGDGVRLSMLTLDAGGGGVPLLFVPGWCLPGEIWLPQMRRLAPDRRVHALDPRGQGDSEVPQRGYDADRRADDLFDAIEALGRPVIVVAWSLAGVELLHGLPRRGERGLAGVVLVDASLGEGPAGSGEGVAAFRRALREDRPAALVDFAGAIFRRPQPAARIESLAAAMARVPLEASLGMLDWGLDRSRLRAAARGLRAPLQVAVTPQYREQARLHAAARPATRVELFEDAGHALFDDEPDRFAAMLAGFAAVADRRRR
jgi:non-heme chloroperoxidase